MNYRKLFPWLPVIGIPLTIYYHWVYGDTGIENITISITTAIVQVSGILLLVLFP